MRTQGKTVAMLETLDSPIPLETVPVAIIYFVGTRVEKQAAWSFGGREQQPRARHPHTFPPSAVG